LTIFDLKSGFYGLVERFSIARTTVTLISHWIGEIITLNISEVISNWNFRICDVITLFVGLLVFLNFCEHFFEFLVTLGSEILGSSNCKTVWISLLGKFGCFILLAIVLVMTLKFASICFPTEVHFVDQVYQQILLL